MSFTPTPIPTGHVERIDAGIASEAERLIASHDQARAALAQWRDFRGFAPFGSADSRHVVDRTNGILSGAGCILSALSAAFEDAGTLIGKHLDSQLDDRSGSIIAGALDGVATLIDLAAFLQE